MGARECMDRFAVIANFADDADSSFYAVFDGHGSSAAAEFAAQRLYRNIESQWPLRSSPRGKSAPLRSEEDSSDSPRSVPTPTSARHRAPSSDIRAPVWPIAAPSATASATGSANTPSGASSLHASWSSEEWDEHSEAIRHVIRRGFRLTHEQFCAEKVSASSSSSSPSSSLADTSLVGTTAAVAIVVGRRVVVAHVGDSRAILFQSKRSDVAGDQAQQATRSPESAGKQPASRTTMACLTEDHVPSLDREQARLESLGAPLSEGRVGGVLAMTRCIGDGKLCPWITCEPDISIHSVNEEEDSMLLLATDGLWSVLSEEEMVSALDASSKTSASDLAAVEEAGVRRGTVNPPAGVARVPMRTIAERLVAQAALLNADDDSTALLIDLRAPRQPASRGESPRVLWPRKRPREEGDEETDDPGRKRRRKAALPKEVEEDV